MSVFSLKSKPTNRKIVGEPTELMFLRVVLFRFLMPATDSAVLSHQRELAVDL